MSRRFTPYLFAIAIIAAFSAMLIGNGMGAIKPAFAQAVPTPSASTTVVFASQGNPSNAADDSHSYTYNITANEAVANAAVATIPRALLWDGTPTPNAHFSDYRPHYSISTETGDGTDHDKFAIDNESGEITIAAGQTLTANTYNITLKAQIWNTNSNQLETPDGNADIATPDSIDVAITVTTAPTVPIVRFASQDDPNVVAADGESYTFTVPRAGATSNTRLGTIRTIIVPTAQYQQPHYSVSSDAGAGADHDKFQMAEQEGWLIIAPGMHPLSVGTYNITVTAYVAVSEIRVEPSVSDEIDVTIEVVQPEVQFASQADPSVAAADTEGYEFNR